MSAPAPGPADDGVGAAIRRIARELEAGLTEDRVIFTLPSAQSMEDLFPLAEAQLNQLFAGDQDGPASQTGSE